jgi:hypothetical protein
LDVSILWQEVAFAASGGAPVIPTAVVAVAGRSGRIETWVFFGEPLPAGANAADIAAAVRRLAETAVE